MPEWLTHGMSSMTACSIGGRIKGTIGAIMLQHAVHEPCAQHPGSPHWPSRVCCGTLNATAVRL